MKYRQYKDNTDNKPTRYFSDRQEKTIAKSINGKQTSNSGATPYNKGDISTDKVLVECKTKTKSSNSISIQKDWIDKLISESIFMKKPFWSLFFNFGPDEPNYVIISESLYLQLLDKINNNEIE